MARVWYSGPKWLLQLILALKRLNVTLAQLQPNAAEPTRSATSNCHA